MKLLDAQAKLLALKQEVLHTNDAAFQKLPQGQILMRRSSQLTAMGGTHFESSFV